MSPKEATVDPPSRGSRLDADHPENGVLIPCRFTTIGVEATRIGALCERITEIEGRADDIHNEGLQKLYQAHARSDPMAFVTGKEIYDHLETVVDCFDDIGNEIQSIVLEQA
jgi:uncharacterized protein Yka (UPF0111/DUF47 family)